MTSPADPPELYLDHAKKCERLAAVEEKTQVRAHYAELATQ
jgi:hypothetical protein